jgi:hypothetical protein
MARRLAQMLGIAVALVAIIGLFAGGGQLWGIANTDMAMDLVRIAAAAALLYAGFGTSDDRTTANIVMGVGIAYIGMGLLGLVSPTLFGLLPSALPGADVAFHIITGALGVMAAVTDHSHHHSATHTV